MMTTTTTTTNHGPITWSFLFFIFIVNFHEAQTTITCETAGFCKEKGTIENYVDLNNGERITWGPFVSTGCCKYHEMEMDPGETLNICLNGCDCVADKLVDQGLAYVVEALWEGDPCQSQEGNNGERKSESIESQWEVTEEPSNCRTPEFCKGLGGIQTEISDGVTTLTWVGLKPTGCCNMTLENGMSGGICFDGCKCNLDFLKVKNLAVKEVSWNGDPCAAQNVSGGGDVGGGIGDDAAGVERPRVDVAFVLISTLAKFLSKTLREF